MISDNIVADFIERNGNTISFINYRGIDLTNSIFVDKVSSGDDIGIKYIQSLINSRNDGLDEIVSNNGFHHWYGVCWYYTTDDYVYSYSILLLLSTVFFGVFSALGFFGKNPNQQGVDKKRFGGICFCLTLYFSPLVDYLSPKYYKQFNKNNININYTFSFRKQLVFYLAILAIVVYL